MRSRKGMHTDRDAWRNLAVTLHATARPESLSQVCALSSEDPRRLCLMNSSFIESEDAAPRDAVAKRNETLH